MAELLPEVTLRPRTIAEIPKVPRSFYDDAVLVPSQWWTHPAAYLQRSAAYADDRAEEWDWPTTQLAGGHLDLCVLPEPVSHHVVDLVRELDRRAG